jgi:acyl-CoA thioesterase I
MARGPAIEKGKEVEKMKRGMFISSILATGLFFMPLPSMQAEPGARVIVALGDSLTAGLGLPQDEAFPAQLEAALKARGNNVTVLNAGVSGDTAQAALKRLDWALPDDASAVIVELGGNDALQGIPPEGTKAALAAIIEQIQARGLPILLAGMESPRNMGKDYVEAFRAVYADLAERYKSIFYPFFMEGAALTDGMMQGDGIHPNARGVAAIVERILPKVEELLAQAEAGKPPSD